MRLFLCSVILSISSLARAETPAPDAAWDQTLAKAKGTEVVFSSWGGSDSINSWIDKWVAPEMAKRFGVKVKRQPYKDTVDVVNKLTSEKQAGKKADGSIDLVWINGENFKLAKTAGVLHGPFTDQLPSFRQYYDAKAPDITTDFGTPVDGFEAPYGKAQFVFVYDSAKVKEPPRSFEALRAWAAQNPGRFTYPAPPDFTGSAFVRQVVYATTGGYAQYLPKVDLELMAKKLPAAWSFLNAMKPHLWMKGETYPDGQPRLNQLYSDGEVWMTMGYSPTTAEAEMAKGTFPKSTRTFVMKEGTIANTHFVGIPFNAKNVEGGKVLANFLLSPDAQISKFDPKLWGDFPALDPTKLTDAQRQQLESIDLGISTLPVRELASHRVPEIQPEYLVQIEKEWAKQVAQKKASH